ncbi:4-hydroxy-tetrahydrodipicolinate synthase [Ruminiclostridium sufflavum DSM 19573]|uniref:4-hydroxy-tetrahydrodipicolinate synthase n=1 Tax=Ruminiclostridium sufflavum DSM 19573 TaxID=1121337 RepID=A0A318YAM9_9FIRM|nr:dihydrodipicolinate synthase family protein [Ruminiclostridium sufflavum]PYG89513.1 4-hydroxy-tetrahydrodipicolinate synthase [Ruminiclostridium sufflavum DSM 19573]
MKKLYGVTTAMVTPFERNGNVDIKAVSGIVEFLISKGVNCLYPLGTTGEMYHMSVEERKAVAETVVKSANGRVTVYIHVGAMCQNDTIELAKHASEIGADGIGVVTPSFFGVNDREIEEYYVAVAKSVPEDFPIYLYNIPQCSANDLKADVAKRIADRCSNVVGIKYSYPDFVRTQEYLGINDGDFSVLVGADRLFNVALAMGCSGVVSGISCVYPEPFVDIYKAFMDGNIEEAARIQKIAVRYVETLKGGSNMSFFKEALKLRGIDAGYMRAPQLDITKDEIELMNEQLSKIGYKK